MTIYETGMNFVHISQLICRLPSIVDSFDGLWRPVHEHTEFPDFEQLKVTQHFYHLQGPYVPPQIFFLTIQTCGRGRALFL